MKREEIIAELERRIHAVEPWVQYERKSDTAGQVGKVAWTNEFYEMLLSTLTLLKYLEAEEHIRICERLLEELFTKNKGLPSALLGVMQSCRNLVHAGLLVRSGVLATADAMNDVLEQAEELIDSDYKDAACVLIGGALETTFNKMLEQDGYDGDLSKVKLKQKNDMLVKRDKYDKVTHGQVAAFADLRNEAAHGHYDNVRKEQVADFLKFTRDFIMRWYAPKLT